MQESISCCKCEQNGNLDQDSTRMAWRHVVLTPAVGDVSIGDVPRGARKTLGVHRVVQGDDVVVVTLDTRQGCNGKITP